jgi:quercetin dioxygenase-like cupin family protein
MFSRLALPLALVTVLVSASYSQSDSDRGLPVVVSLHKLTAGQWVEKVWGDPEKAGEVFAIRIHNDAGYIAMPHVHPMDEHVVVVQGAWWFGMGRRFEPSALKEVKLGDFTIDPKNMPHFGWAKVETTIHVYGVGPFRSTLVDPVYELTNEGTFLLTSLLQPGKPTNSSPPECFALKVGAHVKSAETEGAVVGARCSPANYITQYWIEKPDGRRFWARVEELQESVR